MAHTLDDYLDRMYALTPELSDGDAVNLARNVGFICDRRGFLQYLERREQRATAAAASKMAGRQ